MGRCGVFNQPDRPYQCQQYDGMQCGYKQQYLSKSSSSHTRVNLKNFEQLAQYYLFDDVGQLMQQPSLETLHQTFAS